MVRWHVRGRLRRRCSSAAPFVVFTANAITILVVWPGRADMVAFTSIAVLVGIVVVVVVAVDAVIVTEVLLCRPRRPHIQATMDELITKLRNDWVQALFSISRR